MKEASFSQMCQTRKKVQAVQYKQHGQWKFGNKNKEVNYCNGTFVPKAEQKSRMKGLQVVVDGFIIFP